MAVLAGARVATNRQAGRYSQLKVTRIRNNEIATIN